jgi:hypothetical protein
LSELSAVIDKSQQILTSLEKENRSKKVRKDRLLRIREQTLKMKRSKSHTRTRSPQAPAAQTLENSGMSEITLLRNVECAVKTIVDLDFQLQKAKQIICKYKDLVVKIQLQLNARDLKIS